MCIPGEDKEIITFFVSFCFPGVHLRQGKLAEMIFQREAKTKWSVKVKNYICLKEQRGKKKSNNNNKSGDEMQKLQVEE